MHLHFVRDFCLRLRLHLTSELQTLQRADSAEVPPATGVSHRQLSSPTKSSHSPSWYEEVVPDYSVEVFLEHYRLSKETVNKLSHTFERTEYFNNLPGQYGNIPVLHEVLIYLWYIGHQTCSFRDVVMQGVCDHRRKILDLFVGYPGSVHDSRVFTNSPLGLNLEVKFQQYFILGNSGYPLQLNLRTPYKDRGDLTRHQQNYNVKLATNRYVIEHSFGVLNQKFRHLYHIKLRSIKLIVHLNRAACVLHYIALEENVLTNNEYTEGNNIPEVQIENEEEIGNGEDIEARLVRDRVSNSLHL